MFHVKQFYKNPYSPSLDVLGLVKNVNFNVDAITLIVEGESNVLGMRDIWRAYQKKAERDGFRVSAFTSHGYIGAAVSSVRYSFNTKREAAMFQITGRETPSALVELIELEGYATRVDLQATFELFSPVPDLAKFIHEARVYVGNTAGIRLDDYRYISGKDGDTLYVGSRQSSKMLRIYDKSYDYNVPRGTIWRWEIQYNRDAARALWIALDGLERNSELFKNFIARTLFDDCHRKGVRLPVEYAPVQMAEIPKLSSSEPDRERYLKWMRESVSPVVKWLTARGELELVLEALGIQSLKYQIEQGDSVLAVVTDITNEIVSRETISRAGGDEK
jgi:hypothetical protein